MHAWIEVSQSALYHNVATLEQLAGEKEIGCVIKNNAYGHGLDVMADALLARNARYFLFTAGTQEAIAVKRRHPYARVCPMSFIDTPYEACVVHGIRVLVYTKDAIDALDFWSQKYNTVTYVHLKVDTGMHRLGVSIEHVQWYIRYIQACSFLYLEGVFTHLSDLACAQAWVAQQQLEAFYTIYAQYHNMIPYWHAGSTGSVLMADVSNIIRVGTGLYGLLKSNVQNEHVSSYGAALRHVLSWYARVIDIKWIPPQAPIGYDRCFTSDRWTRVAYVPIGYGDGYPCALSNRSVAELRNSYVPLIGFTSMNVIMFDVTDMPSACVGDTITLIGSSPRITSDYLARQAGHIRLELLSNINAHIPRYIGV